MVEWGHSFIEIVGVVVPIILYLASNKYTAKKENQKRHEENTKRLDELVAEQKYLVPHDHNEKDGPLQVAGIIRRKKNGV